MGTIGELASFFRYGNKVVLTGHEWKQNKSKQNIIQTHTHYVNTRDTLLCTQMAGHVCFWAHTKKWIGSTVLYYTHYFACQKTFWHDVYEKVVGNVAKLLKRNETITFLSFYLINLEILASITSIDKFTYLSPSWKV